MIYHLAEIPEATNGFYAYINVSSICFSAFRVEVVDGLRCPLRELRPCSLFFVHPSLYGCFIKAGMRVLMLGGSACAWSSVPVSASLSRRSTINA